MDVVSAAQRPSNRVFQAVPLVGLIRLYGPLMKETATGGSSPAQPESAWGGRAQTTSVRHSGDGWGLRMTDQTRELSILRDDSEWLAAAKVIYDKGGIAVADRHGHLKNTTEIERLNGLREDLYKLVRQLRRHHSNEDYECTMCDMALMEADRALRARKEAGYE